MALIVIVAFLSIVYGSNAESDYVGGTIEVSKDGTQLLITKPTNGTL